MTEANESHNETDPATIVAAHLDRMMEVAAEKKTKSNTYSGLEETLTTLNSEHAFLEPIATGKASKSTTLDAHKVTLKQSTKVTVDTDGALEALAALTAEQVEYVSAALFETTTTVTVVSVKGTSTDTQRGVTYNESGAKGLSVEWRQWVGQFITSKPGKISYIVDALEEEGE